MTNLVRRMNNRFFFVKFAIVYKKKNTKLLFNLVYYILKYMSKLNEKGGTCDKV